jgi:hypothetical protein
MASGNTCGGCISISGGDYVTTVDINNMNDHNHHNHASSNDNNGGVHDLGGIGHFTAEDVQELMDFMSSSSSSHDQPHCTTANNGHENNGNNNTTSLLPFHTVESLWGAGHGNGATTTATTNNGGAHDGSEQQQVIDHHLTPVDPFPSATQHDETSDTDMSPGEVGSESAQQQHPPRLFRQGSSMSTTASTAATTPGISDATRCRARIERKRSREKERRNEVNKQMQELTDVLKCIEDEENNRAAARNSKNGNGTSNPRPFPSFSPTNRVELIGRTVAHLERLWELSKEQEVEIKKLQQKLEEQAKVSDTAQRSAAASSSPSLPDGTTSNMGCAQTANAAVGTGATSAGSSSSTDASNFHNMKQQQVRLELI